MQLPLVARTGDDRLGNNANTYDDRRAPIYGSTFVASGSLSGSALSTPIKVNYPSTLTRFFGGTAPGVLERQNLFSGDILVTGSVVKSAVEPFIGELPITYTPPYNESHRHEQDVSTLTSSFYASGSSVAAVGSGFEQPLKSKTQVRFQLPVNVPTQMPGITSSIYYYNWTDKCWEVPANSTYVLAVNGSTPPSPNPGGGGDWMNPAQWLFLGSMAEDARGFSPVGSLASSGSHTATTPSFANNYTPDQSDYAIGANYYNTLLPLFAGKSYPKSIQRNLQYRATADETFTIPITSPFLIEKATFEIPLALGPGWFNDQTQVFYPYGQDGVALDFAGPAMTVALYRQVQLGENSDAPTVLDLIMTGTITHTFDYVSGVIFEKPATSGYHFLRPVGFQSFATPAGAVVPVPLDQQFTGSVTVESVAASVAGVDLSYNFLFYPSTGSPVASATIQYLTTPILPLPQAGTYGGGTSYTNAQVTPYISPFGRSAAGFQQAGRAILGNEFGTLQSMLDQTGNSVASPFFTGPTVADIPPTIYQQILTGSMQSGFTFLLWAMAVVSLKSHFVSPYLVMPGDKLVLSISKMRPVIYNILSNTSAQFLTSSLQHDVKLMPGNIDITLYGSQVQGGAEYHDTLNQPLGSDVCHEVVGVDPVLDQFEPAYRNEYSGSFTDNVMIGQLLTAMVANGQLTFTQGNRFRIISDLAATLSGTVFVDKRIGNPSQDRYVVNGVTGSFPYSAGNPAPNVKIVNSVPATLDTSLANAEINNSKAYREQPWIEQVGSVRLSQFVDDSERYWDSLMPAVDQAFAADGCGIFVTRYGAFGNSEQVNVVTASLVGSSSLIAPPNTQPLGWLWFDYQLPFVIDQPVGTSLAPLINANWTKAFPFEPRYQNASRQLSVSKGLIATYLYQPTVQAAGGAGNFNPIIAAGNPLVLPIQPTPVSGFLFGPVQQGTSVDSTIVGYYYIGFWIFIFGFWLYIQFPVAEQGLVYSVNDLCNGWISDSFIGPQPPASSSFLSASQSSYGLNPYGYFTTGSADLDDISRALFGFGDHNGYFQRTNYDTSVSLLGAGHYAEFRDQEGPHPNGLGINGTDNNIFKYSPVIRGWKYGVASGLPLFSKAYWRRGKFGQFRDMLEQRPFTKYYESPENNPTDPNFQQSVKDAVVTVKYLSPDGRLTAPENTWSSNLSFECTSSIPYIEGVPTNRPVVLISTPTGIKFSVNPLILNKHILTFREDIFGNRRL